MLQLNRVHLLTRSFSIHFYESSIKFLIEWLVTRPILKNLFSQHIFSIMVATDHEQLLESIFFWKLMTWSFSLRSENHSTLICTWNLIEFPQYVVNFLQKTFFVFKGALMQIWISTFNFRNMRTFDMRNICLQAHRSNRIH